jgi:hypothetical protein
VPWGRPFAFGGRLAVQCLASFAEDLDGHLYAISLDGPVYRFVEPSSVEIPVKH